MVVLNSVSRGFHDEKLKLPPRYLTLIFFLSAMFSSGKIDFRGKHHLLGEALFLRSKTP